MTVFGSNFCVRDNSLRFVTGKLKSFWTGRMIILALIMVQTYERNLPIHTPLTPIDGQCLDDEVMINENAASTWFIATRDVPDSLHMKCVKCTQFTTYGESCVINSIRLNAITITETTYFNTKTPKDCRSNNGYRTISGRSQCAPKALQGNILYKNNSNQVACFIDFSDSCYQCRSDRFLLNECWSCGYGYYKNGGQCRALQNQAGQSNIHCVYSNNHDICLTCENRYYRKVDNKCQRCPNNCLDCQNAVNNPPRCTRCELGYDITTGSNLCTTNSLHVMCNTLVVNCNKCINITVTPSSKQITQCIQCKQGYYPLRQLMGCTSDCQKVIQNCLICYISKLDDKTKCRKCKSGFYVNYDGQCMQCSDSITNCQECPASRKCTQCQTSYYLINPGICHSCTVAGAACVQCKLEDHQVLGATQNLLTCSKCLTGQFLDPLNKSVSSVITDNQCKPCLQNCKHCTVQNTCIACQRQFYLSNDQKECQDCNEAIPDCLSCQPKSITVSCLQCSLNTALQIDPNNSGRNICGGCRVIDPNCIECQRGNVCTKCNPDSGTYIDFDTNKCKPCIYPCKTCSKKYKCLSCTHSWMFVKNNTKGQCIDCRRIISNCISCQAQINSPNTQFQVNCIQCKAGHFLQNNPTLPSIPRTCWPCQEVNTYSDSSNNCIPCSNKCQQCTGIDNCHTCLNVYAKRWKDDKLDCYDKCGDKKIVTLECDLGIGNIFDGCTSQCQVEPGFVCQLYFSKNPSLVPNKQDKDALTSYLHNLSERNSDEHFYSRCSYNGTVEMSIKHILKERFSNQLSVEVKLEPFLHAYNFLSSPELDSLFKLLYNSSIIHSSLYTTELVPKNGSVLFTLQLEHHLTHPLTIQLSHSVLPDQKNFTFTRDSSLTFITDDQTGLKAFFFTPDELTLWKSVHTTMQILSIVAIVGTLISVALKNLAGIELLWILQSMYVSLFWYQEPLTLPMLSLSGLSFSTGFNPSAAFSKLYTPQTINSRLLYESSFVLNSTSNFIELQFTVFIFPLLYLLSQLAWVFEDVRNSTVIIWARYFNVFFFNDGLMLATLFMLQSLINQTLALYFGWEVLEPFSQYLATILIAFGGVCMLIAIVSWLKAEQPKYEKSNKKNRPYGLLLSAFSRYNMPIIKRKFYSVYIIIIVMSALSSAFVSFYPLMPGMLYIFLAFLIGIYRPYNRQISNYRALFFALVIAYGYFLRVVYVFSFTQDAFTPGGYTLGNVWTIYFWIVLVIAAFIFFVVDVVKAFRLSREIAKKLQEKQIKKIEGECKILHRKIVEETKKYESHKNHLQNLSYNNFYHHGIGPKIDFDEEINEEEIAKKFEEAKKKTRPKPVEKDEVFYISNKNSKKPRKKSPQNEGSDQTIKSRAKKDENINQWVEIAKKKLQQERFQNSKKLQQKRLSIAYERIIQILEHKEKLIDEKFKLYEAQDSSNFDLMTKLVQLEKSQRIKIAFEKSLGTRIQGEGSQQNNDLQSLVKQIKEEDVEQFKVVKAWEKERRGRNGQNNFPQVEIHYKKAQKMNEGQRQEKNRKKNGRQSIAEQKMLEVSDEQLRVNRTKRQVDGISLYKK